MVKNIEKSNPYVKIKQKYQITIPHLIRKKIDIKEGDILEIIEKNGVLLFIPQKIKRKSNKKEKKTLLSLLGANSGSGLYESGEEIDKYICNLRSEWK